jgi:hypothetical protein
LTRIADDFKAIRAGMRDLGPDADLLREALAAFPDTDPSILQDPTACGRFLAWFQDRKARRAEFREWYLRAWALDVQKREIAKMNAAR